MSELPVQKQITQERLLRARGLLIEEFDKFISSAKAKYEDRAMDTMDILLDFEEMFLPAYSEKLQKLYVKEKKLEVMQANEEDSGDDDDEA